MAGQAARWLAAAAAIGCPFTLAGSAGAQEAPLPYAGVTATPATINTPGQKLTVAGPGFPDQEGCRFGSIRALLPGQTIAQGRVFQMGSLDADWSFERDDFHDGPFTPGTYTIALDCADSRGKESTWTTEATFTIAASATTTTTSTTTTLPSTATTGPGGATGTVDPAAAKPGATVKVEGGGFRPAAALKIALGPSPGTALGTTTATDAGTYAASVKLPITTPPGAQPIVVSGPAPDGTTRSTTATLTVQDLTCRDFSTSEAAKPALTAGDPHGLDADKDGVPCEAAAGGATRTAAGGSGTAAAGGALPQTGTERMTFGAMAGLTLLTVGALLIGLSHPPAHADGHHRRSRRR